MSDTLNDETLERVQRLRAFAESLGCTVGQFALAWCLRKPSVASVIVGASRVQQIEENVKAAELSFGDDVWTHAESIISGEVRGDLV
jgi:aryl-alcohol dehydrogenase-like predicted oxidoreductase